MKSDKSKDLAIALNVRRTTKKMAKGGMVDAEKSIKSANIARPDAGFGAIISKRYAEGGEVKHKSIADAVMARRKSMNDSSDDQVDLSENAEEQPNLYDKLNRMALLDDTDAEEVEDIEQPMDSNEHSVEIDGDKHDRVSKMRQRMKKMME
jgi:hypothetical protein